MQHVVSLSPLALVTVRLRGSTFSVRALIDVCLPGSQICQSIVRRYQLPVDDAFCRVTMKLPNDDTKELSVTARVADLRNVVTPAEPVPESIRTHFAGFIMAEPRFYEPGRVGMILGPEIYQKVVTGKNYTVPGFPSATYTVFGWVVAGSCQT